MIVDLQGADRWQVIEELVNSLVETGKISGSSRGPIVEAVRKRELAMSSGIGSGIAIPHASTDLVSEVVYVKGRSTKGIDFNSLDDKPVYRVGLFLVPAGQFQKHLHFLADFAKMLHRGNFDEV